MTRRTTRIAAVPRRGVTDRRRLWRRRRRRFRQRPTHRRRPTHRPARARRGPPQRRTAPRRRGPPQRPTRPRRRTRPRHRGPPRVSDGGGEGWAVSTDDCVDPDAANEPIEGTVQIASSMPLSGGPAAAAFAPVAAGFQAYIDYANENELVPGYELALTVGDDQYNPATTPDVVNGALDSGAHIFSGIIGTPEQRRRPRPAQRGVHPAAAGPHRRAGLGRGRGLPVDHWALLPYDVETEMYVADIVERVPRGRHGRRVLHQQRLRRDLQRRLRGARRRQQHRDRRRPDDRGAGDRAAAGAGRAASPATPPT